MIEVQTIVADPPWKFGDKLPGPKRGAEKHYPVMTTSDIEKYLDEELRRGGFELAKDCRLFLWRVSSMQEEALRVVRAWGFVPKSEIVWLKRTRTGERWFGMGRQVRNEHESCIIATMGKPTTLDKSIRSTFIAQYTRHSGKPDAFFDIVERLSPGPYVELFARVPRPGWIQVGNELEGSDG